MGDDKRLHRRDPERSAPIRSFNELYISRQRVRGRDETAANGGVREDPTRAQEQGVDLAYRVIEQHINDGRRTAAMLNRQPYNTRTVTDVLQEVIERTLRYSSELLPLWLEALTTAVRIEPARVPSASPAMSSEENQHQGGSTLVAIEMISTQPVTVSIDLRENSERMPLAALGLRAVDRSKPELSDIGIEPDVAGGIKLRICIPQSYPPGAYSGVIVNRETGESRGTLTVRVSEP